MLRTRNFRAVFVCAAVLGLLAGCETAPPRPQFPELTFGHLPPIRLNVAELQVVRAYASPGQKPNVEQLFPVLPAAVMERWAHDRLKPVGAEGVARAIVKEASVVEVPLPRTTGITGTFTTDQSERYDAVLEMSVEASSRDSGRRAMVSARATRSRTVPETITLNDREKVWFELTEALMNDLNASLERQIQDNFGAFLAQGTSLPNTSSPGASSQRGGIRTEPLPPAR